MHLVNPAPPSIHNARLQMRLWELEPEAKYGTTAGITPLLCSKRYSVVYYIESVNAETKLEALGQYIPPPRHVCRGCLWWAGYVMTS